MFLPIVGLPVKMSNGDDYDGLRPGFRLILMGLCKDRKQALRLIKKAPRSIKRKVKPYVRGVALKEPVAEACPRPAK